MSSEKRVMRSLLAAGFAVALSVGFGGCSALKTASDIAGAAQELKADVEVKNDGEEIRYEQGGVELRTTEDDSGSVPLPDEWPDEVPTPGSNDPVGSMTGENGYMSVKFRVSESEYEAYLAELESLGYEETVSTGDLENGKNTGLRNGVHALMVGAARTDDGGFVVSVAVIDDPN